MIAVAREGLIVGSVDSVWAVLADFGAISSWAPNVDHSCLLSDQNEGVGTVRRIQSARTTVVETVTVWEPGAALAYRITGLPPIIKELTNTWQLTESVGSVRVVLTTRVDAGPRPPQRVIARAVGRRLAPVSQEMIGGLQRRIEQDRKGAHA